jgi:AP-4 complex subunit epsilon-1
MLMHRFLQLDPAALSEQADLLRRALCDRDPSVMGATLHILLAQMKADPLPFKDLVPSFISILRQIIGECAVFHSLHSRDI